MLSLGIKQYKTFNKSLKERQMEKFIPKKKTQNYKRKSMSLPRKSLLEAKFSNERLSDALNVSHISASFSHKSPESKHQKTFSVNFQTKFDNNQHSRLSFVDFATTKNAFRKILKLNTMKGQKNTSNKSMVWKKSPKGQLPKTMMTQIDESTNQMKKCIQLSTKSAIRKSYHQKFHKTRLIFQQQEKMKKIDKINKIYECKNAVFNKLNRSEDINELIKARKQSIASKWAKRYEKHDIYQISENGQECERSL